MSLTPAARAVRERLFRDFEFYAQHALFIRTKQAQVVPLVLNKAQKKLLEAVTSQLERHGFVRLITLKGRQMRSSTFVEAFLYWWVSQRKAQKALVVARDPLGDSGRASRPVDVHTPPPEPSTGSRRYALTGINFRSMSHCTAACQPVGKISPRNNTCSSVSPSGTLMFVASANGTRTCSAWPPG